VELKYVSGFADDVAAEVIALCVYAEGKPEPQFKALDKSMNGLLSERMNEVGFASGLGETLVVRPSGATPNPSLRAVALVGAGRKRDLSPGVLRDVAAEAVKAAGQLRCKSLGIVLPSGIGKDPFAAMQRCAEGAVLATYRFDRYRSESARKPSTVTEVTIIGAGKKPGGQAAAAKKVLSRAEAVAKAIMHARDLVNEPAHAMTPRQLAAEAEALAKRHASLKAKILGPKECEKLGMGMFLAVGRGSDEEVRLIHLTYTPSRKPKKRIALVGKGITFDSGGYSLKPSSSMLDMKTDMSGSAAVLAAMSAVATIGSPFEVHASAACAENMVSGRAYRLGDVLRAMNGTTVEINNTDAEGRLALGDALTYAKQKVNPDELFDFATLTGACLVALGPETAGVMSNNEALAHEWLEAARRAGEDMWRLPLPSRLKEQLKSRVADMKNTGGRAGGALTAGLFLREFVGETPWVHVDIAGPVCAARERGATAEGATGFAVASIVEFACP
jgi:leucyl aminopeptidase